MKGTINAAVCSGRFCCARSPEGSIENKLENYSGRGGDRKGGRFQRRAKKTSHLLALIGSKEARLKFDDPTFVKFGDIQKDNCVHF